VEGHVAGIVSFLIGMKDEGKRVERWVRGIYLKKRYSG